MTQTTARLKKIGKNFEIMVDMEKALEFKKTSDESVKDFLEIDKIFSDSKKGFAASSEDLQNAFKTEDVNKIAETIVREGEILISQEYRDKEQEKKFNQVIDFLSKNALNPQTGLPHSFERIKSTLEQSHVNIKNMPIESQINEIIEQINKTLPIKLEVKKVRITLPSIYTGKAYGLVNQYKEKENWLNDGSLEIVVSVPAGLIMDFYDKLNSITHGSAITEEVKGE